MADPGGGVERGRALGGPGFDVVDAVLASVLRRRMLAGGESVLVAVSGGPDSSCLLDVLARLQDKLDLELFVAHVDHGLSSDSEEVAATVAREAATLGYDVHVARARDLQGPNLQARAREFRYEFFATIAAQVGATKIATGHTLDDRVETTLARLIHGAGPAGLAGIPPIEGPRIRPLIDLRRATTRAYCREVEIEFYDDPANNDERFERVRVRNQVLGAIEDLWGDGAVRAIATSSERLLEDSTALASLGSRLAADLVQGEEGETRIELEPLLAMPRALRRRVLEAAVGRVRDRSGGIDAALDALDDDKAMKPLRFSVAAGGEITIESDHVLIKSGRQLGE